MNPTSKTSEAILDLAAFRAFLEAKERSLVTIRGFIGDIRLFAGWTRPATRKT